MRPLAAIRLEQSDHRLPHPLTDEVVGLGVVVPVVGLAGRRLVLRPEEVASADERDVATELADLPDRSLRDAFGEIVFKDVVFRGAGSYLSMRFGIHIDTAVVEGADISSPMKRGGVFPPMVCYMIGVGEQAGNLEEMLERIAVTYDEEVDLATQKLTSVIEPLIIVLLASVVAGVVIAIVMPLMQLQRT